MPLVSPCNYRLVKTINRHLLVAVTYSEVVGLPDQLDVTIEFINTKSTKSSSSNDESRTDNGEGNADLSSDGWLKSFWIGEKAPLTVAQLPEVPLFLGYVQMAGYVRVNRHIGGDGTLDAAADVYWKNLDYLSDYGGKEDAIYEGIQETPFIKDYGSSTPRKGRMGGVGDLNSKRFDHTGIYLLHDLFYSFNTMAMPGKNAPPIPEPHHQALAENLHENIVPFYVTAQHLLFSSVRLPEELVEVYRIRMPRPPGQLPPSYNTRLTGSAGESGAVSICYSFIVGVLEHSSEAMQPRAVYFPLELKPGKKGWDREWVQRNYLQDTLLDKDWKPQLLLENDKSEDNSSKQKGTNGTVGRTKEKFVRDLEMLIESSIHVVAANERRKSSVSLLSNDNFGSIQQIPPRLKISYQIRVNNQTLCTLTLSKPYFHVGDDINFFLELHADSSVSTTVIGFTTHVEAHEIFNLESETNKKVVNFYKVTPTVKINTFADALADAYQKSSAGIVAGTVSLPRFLTQQFQSSSFMDLKYFLVCRFVLNGFNKPETLSNIDDDPQRYADFIQDYKMGNESTEFKFLIPLTVLP